MSSQQSQQSQWLHPLAGQPVPASMLVNLPRLIAAYYTERPDISIPAQQVAFGTAGHRGSSFDVSFNEWHLLAIAQAICEYRFQHGIHGPLFLGIDTHALSIPAKDSMLQVLIANGVAVLQASRREYTPTPALSLAILSFNRARQTGLADGVVLTPSHNPPESGGIKYNTCKGDGADMQATTWITKRANYFLSVVLNGVNQIPLSKVRASPLLLTYDFLGSYVDSLATVIDIEAIRHAALHIGVDPLGGAGVHYWERIATQYRLNLDLISTDVDERFAFMSLDWDGQIRLDPSSPYAMQRLIQRKTQYDVAFACDTDHDRHGIVTASAGLIPPNHFLAVAVDYLFRHRPLWDTSIAVGKSVVCSQIIDRIAQALEHSVYETPVGFKWFGDRLYDGTLGFAGEESAGASLLRRDGSVWTTDKDGIVMGLLAAEIMAVTGTEPGLLYGHLSSTFGNPAAKRIDCIATSRQKEILASLHFAQLARHEIAGEPILHSSTLASGNQQAIGGIKLTMKNAWLVIRPSGTESLYKIYAESFLGDAHLQQVIDEAQLLLTRLFVAEQSIVTGV